MPRWSALRSSFTLVFIGVASLVVTLASNGLAGQALPSQQRWLAGACVPSLLAAIFIYLLAAPARPFAWAWSDTPWRRLIRLSALWLSVWLAGLVLYAVAHGKWFAYTHGAASLLCFGLIGPLGEELLFRGAIFELAQRTFIRSALAPLLISTLLFSLYHLQLHHFRVTPFVLMQMAFTLPMGLVFARVRALSGSIWPAFGLHVLTNLPSCFGTPLPDVV